MARPAESPNPWPSLRTPAFLLLCACLSVTQAAATWLKRGDPYLLSCHYCCRKDNPCHLPLGNNDVVWVPGCSHAIHSRIKHVRGADSQTNSTCSACCSHRILGSWENIQLPTSYSQRGSFPLPRGQREAETVMTQKGQASPSPDWATPGNTGFDSCMAESPHPRSLSYHLFQNWGKSMCLGITPPHTRTDQGAGFYSACMPMSASSPSASSSFPCSKLSKSR